MSTKLSQLPNQYSSGMVSESFWFLEVKTFIKLMVEGCTLAEIRTEVVQRNLFGAPNETRATRMYRYICKRVDVLDDEGRILFLNSDVQTQKLIVLVCAMATNRLFFEFVNEVYREKIILGSDHLRPSDGAVFFKNKEVQSEKISNWKDDTKTRLMSAFLNFLAEAGLIVVSEGGNRIITPILDDQFKNYLEKNGGKPYANALTGVL